MEFDLVTIWGHMGFINKFISISLLLMGIACLAIYVERSVVISRNLVNARAFSAKATAPLEAGDFDAVLAVAEVAKKNWLAELTKIGLTAYKKEIAGNLTPLERAQREVERFLEAYDTQLRRGMPVLASVGSTAPFIGLLGTVIGIIVAFQAISVTGSGGISSVAAGISEALVETALGLLVAIPAVLLFNHLNTRLDHFQKALDQGASRLLDILEDLGQSPQFKKAA